MKLIVGLGNPGNEYKDTRHNIGFKAISDFAEKKNIVFSKKKFNGIYSKSKNFIICKPLTYMNLSGEFVKKMVDFFKIDIEDILVIYDDLDLPLGKIRLRKNGTAGGQKGMLSIIQSLKNKNIHRLKIGIGRPAYGDVISHVLGKLNQNEKKTFDSLREEINLTIERFISGVK